MTRDTILQGALALSPDDRVRLVDELLDSLVEPDGCSELSPEDQAELLRRLDAHTSDPGTAVSWDEIEKRITSRT